MTTWFTADTHFGHSRIVSLCQRPYADVDEMDADLVAQWNAVVQPDDDVWHLGDFAYKCRGDFKAYARKLRGRIHLIHGNHDSQTVRSWSGWASSQPMAEIAVEGYRLVLLHYGMRVWPKSHHGSIHLYGHSHGSLPGDSQSCDVGVDVWGMRPVQLTQIKQYHETLPARGSVDHHGRGTDPA